MKAAIITFIRAYNYGAVLQSYALNKTLNDMGIDCETIDYSPEYFKKMYQMSAATKFTRPPLHIKYWKDWINKISLGKIVKKRSARFDSFIKNKIKTSPRTYNNYDDICRNLPNYDLFIAGSDQVWNGRLIEYDPFFCLDFPQSLNAVKISYSASFGDKEIDPDHYDEYRRKLAGYKLYSVRDQSSSQKISELVNETAEIVCDPTLLLSAIQWCEIAKHPNQRKPYVLIYMVTYSEQLLDTAIEYAKKNDEDVICIPCIMERTILLKQKTNKNKSIKWISDCSPEDFIGFFKNADYVFASSFHGVVFSLIFHKPFTANIRYRENTNIRVLELLNNLKLSDRVLTDNSNPSEFIDWIFVDNQIDQMRIKALAFLKKAIVD